MIHLHGTFTLNTGLQASPNTNLISFCIFSVPSDIYPLEPVLLPLGQHKQELANIFCGSKCFRLMGHLISTATTEVCHCGIKIAISNILKNEHRCIPIKLYSEQMGKI